jgi:hypothetical protein
VPGEITADSSRIISISGSVDPSYNVQGIITCTIT